MSQDDGDETGVRADGDSHNLVTLVTTLAGFDVKATPGGRAQPSLLNLLALMPYELAVGVTALKSPPEVTAPPVYVERRADLLALVFQFVNLGLTPDGKDDRVALRRLKGQSKQDAFIIVYFPPQSFLEAALPGSANTPPPKWPFIPCAISGPSWLVFRLPAKLDKVPYTLESLLDWKRFELCVYPTAATDEMPAGAKQPDKPPQADLLPTFIEAPARLVLSPHQYAGWANAQYPVTSRSGWSELWHTRLAVRCVNPLTRTGGSNDLLCEGDADARTVRAINRLDLPDKPTPDATLTDDDRRQIVKLSVMRAPLRVERLMLSSLGAWLSLRGDWELTDVDLKELSLNSWTHRATMGRDHYVRVSVVGFLYPFGHRALKVTVTQREFATSLLDAQPGVGAYLRRSVYIVVQQAEKTYDILPQRRTMPFKRVTIKTLITPGLDVSNDPFFRLTKGGEDFLFHLVGEDADGQAADFMSPLYFVEGTTAAHPDLMEPLLNAAVSCDLHGQQVAYAEGDGQAVGARTLGRTSFETAQVVFDARPVEGQVPCFYPRLQEADVRLLAVERLAATPPGVKIGYHAAYESSGFAPAGDGTNGGNPGQVFAELKLSPSADAPAANFPVEKSGGLATPNMNVKGLSLSAGVVSGDLDTFAAGQFVPDSYFDASAKILGGISLSSIIAAAPPPPADPNQPQLPAALAQAPKVTTRTLYQDDRPELGVAGTEIRMDWTPAVQSAGSFITHNNTSLTINTTLVSRLDGSSEYSVTGVLGNFSLNLADIIGIDFEELSFKAGQNKKLDFSPKLGKVSFLGPLAFLNALAAAFEAAGFNDPPFLDVTAEGVRAGYTLRLPPVAVGVMSLDHVSLSVAINLPFDGQPVRARFDFCERHHPFHLIVYGIGGGGFLGVSVGLDGVEVIEAALEFGGCIALALGVSEGSVSLMAGIYFKVEKQVEKDVVSLTGYLRAVGEMEVLGLVCISVEFYMGLSYNVASGVVSGDAIVTVEVEVLCFSKSVDLSLHREFRNSQAFKFVDVIGPSAWDEYCAAFAA